MEDSMEVPLKTKNRAAIWFSNLTPGHIYGENLIQKDACTPVFIVALFTIAQTWNQPKRSSTYEWIKRCIESKVFKSKSGEKKTESTS